MTQLDHPEKSFLLSLSNFLARTKKGKEGECEAGKRRKKALRQKRVSWGLKLLTRWSRVVIFDIKVPKCNVLNVQWITRICDIPPPNNSEKKIFFWSYQTCFRSKAKEWLSNMWPEVEAAKFVSIWRLPLFTYKQVFVSHFPNVMFLWDLDWKSSQIAICQ